MKLMAFVISGMLAGFAGAVFAVLSRAVPADAFNVDVSVNAFVAAVVGGVSSPLGALLGSAYFTLTQSFLGGNGSCRSILQAGGPAVILFLAPGGLVSLINAARDSVLRIVAQRRRIVVPSLFADYDPDLLARQLIPLSEPDPLSGLAALPLDRRFTLSPSSIRAEASDHRQAGPRSGGREAAAIGAAARHAEEFELDGPPPSPIPPLPIATVPPPFNGWHQPDA